MFVSLKDREEKNKMKKAITILNSTMAVGVLLAASSTLEAAGPIVQRNYNQQARIAQGVRSGELTARETVRLETRECRLHNEIRRDRMSGGRLSFGERARIERMQNSLSRDIYIQKHDGQFRP